MKGSYSSFKRVLDFSIIAALLPLLLVPIVLIGLVLALIQGRIFFVQTRLGKDLSRFRILKFSTMTGLKDGKGTLIDDSERITRVGGVLRRYHLDELPQVFNVLVGEMSLVGPRPLLCNYVDTFSEKQNRRHRVKPGLTGLVQISGGNDLSWEQRLSLDIDYVKKQNLLLDLKILLLTLPKLFRPNRHSVSTFFTGA